MSELEKHDMHEGENNSSQLHTHYYETALNQVKKYAPEKAQDMTRVLDSIDRQAVDNYSLFQSSEHEGVTLPFTRVSINRVVNEAFPELPRQQTPEDPEQKKKYLNITIGGITSHPFMAGDMMYDRNMTSLGKVVGPLKEGKPVPDVEDVSFGLPGADGGKITQEWLETRKANGLAAYGKLYAEAITNLVKQGNREDTHVLINGMSLGSSIAQEVGTYLPDDIKEKTQFILDNPVGHEKGKIFSLIKALQVPVGFLGEAVMRALLDPRLKSSIKAEKPFLEALKKRLQSKGIDTEDNEDQKKLKGKAFMQDALDLISGTKPSTEDEEDSEKARIYIRRGMKDPTTFSPLRLARTLLHIHKGENAVESRGRFVEAAVNATHFINRYRVKNWSRIIDNCKMPEEPTAPAALLQ